MKQPIQFQLNGRPTNLTVDPTRMLLWALRTDAALTGTKYGCGQALCGACTVLVNGEAVRSCMYPMRLVAGKEVVTIEGLARNGDLHPLQQAFVDHDALQCGYCTSGMVMSAYSLLAKNAAPSREEILAGMDGNLCRCGSHNRVVRAIQAAADMMEGARP
jgi:aerobic-type carbon monoxide dehydrogenase small subunit (CoxS/CutS family)